MNKVSRSDMKIIKIFQENNEVIELIDNDNTNRVEYTAQLKNIFESNDVVILETSTGSVIIRPHKINAILVSDDNELSGEDDEIVQNTEDFIRG